LQRVAWHFVLRLAAGLFFRRAHALPSLAVDIPDGVTQSTHAGWHLRLRCGGRRRCRECPMSHQRASRCCFGCSCPRPSGRRRNVHAAVCLLGSPRWRRPTRRPLGTPALASCLASGRSAPATHSRAPGRRATSTIKAVRCAAQGWPQLQTQRTSNWPQLQPGLVHRWGGSASCSVCLCLHEQRAARWSTARQLTAVTPVYLTSLGSTGSHTPQIARRPHTAAGLKRGCGGAHHPAARGSCTRGTRSPARCICSHRPRRGRRACARTGRRASARRYGSTPSPARGSCHSATPHCCCHPRPPTSLHSCAVSSLPPGTRSPSEAALGGGCCPPGPPAAPSRLSPAAVGWAARPSSSSEASLRPHASHQLLSNATVDWQRWDVAGIYIWPLM
jgi:hypothetical protein